MPFKDQRAIVTGRKKIYSAALAEITAEELEAFLVRWVLRYPMILQPWKARWAELTSYFKFSHATRKAIYTTNAIEPLNFLIRMTTKNLQRFSIADEAGFHGFAQNLVTLDNTDTGFGLNPGSIRDSLGQPCAVMNRPFTQKRYRFILYGKL